VIIIIKSSSPFTQHLIKPTQKRRKRDLIFKVMDKEKLKNILTKIGEINPDYTLEKQVYFCGFCSQDSNPDPNRG